ncbi:MAG: zinc metallopeptidase, partial [Acholeplasmatales bacterium]|nr:zinc metallopeptidase [Acholeplasmatales bacterium]
MFLEIVEGVSDGLMISIIIVGTLILLLSLIGGIVQIYLMVSYVKYNRRENSIGKTGEEVARLILDNHDLNHIKVSATGSLLFGNSYSHYFKKVRLRRLTYKKKSITSLTMACQKSSLAVLDKENDPAMKTRIVLTPIVFFGPISVIPIVAIGVIFDLLVFNTDGICTIIASIKDRRRINVPTMIIEIINPSLT